MGKRKVNIPILSGNDIEIKAEEVLSYFDKTLLEKAQPTLIVAFVERLQKENGVFLNFNSDLGYTENGNKILGKFISNPRTILIDVSLVNSKRFPFTLAHEFGHLVLHRNLKIDKNVYGEIVDTEYDFITNKKNLTSPRQWIEWQANKIAAALLMPRATFFNSICYIQNKLGITKNIGHVYINKELYSIRDYNSIISYLSKLYLVSKTSIEYRLNSLELLIDKRQMNVHHISEMLRED